jgi:hypothetical protein
MDFPTARPWRNGAKSRVSSRPRRANVNEEPTGPTLVRRSRRAQKSFLFGWAWPVELEFRRQIAARAGQYINPIPSIAMSAADQEQDYLIFDDIAEIDLATQKFTLRDLNDFFYCHDLNR